jgi:hypothetical protein
MEAFASGDCDDVSLYDIRVFDHAPPQEALSGMETHPRQGRPRAASLPFFGF